ncbi:unnamed protein product [Haemonchus placei]|uniref:Uncharacterized protein n=1 Tax=Haemonchus placei TaxID=6290 RepID=A0A3P7Y722_HAEPC|nr:unnamed protein product [Haemonchus placei]
MGDNMPSVDPSINDLLNVHHPILWLHSGAHFSLCLQTRRFRPLNSARYAA